MQVAEPFIFLMLEHKLIQVQLRERLAPSESSTDLRLQNFPAAQHTGNGPWTRTEVDLCGMVKRFSALKCVDPIVENSWKVHCKHWLFYLSFCEEILYCT